MSLYLHLKYNTRNKQYIDCLLLVLLELNVKSTYLLILLFYVAIVYVSINVLINYISIFFKVYLVELLAGSSPLECHFRPEQLESLL